MKVPDEYAYLNTNTLAAEGQQPFEHTQQPHNSMPRSNQKVNSMPRSNHKVARICCRLDPPSTAGPNNMRAIPRKIRSMPHRQTCPSCSVLAGPCPPICFPPYLSLKSNTFPHFCYFLVSVPSKKKVDGLDRADRQHAYRLNLLPSITGRGGGGQPQKRGRAWNKLQGRCGRW